jgi:hypothetical protein
MWDTIHLLRPLVKVKLSLCIFFSWEPCHEGVWGEWIMHSLTSALDGGEWSASRPGRFTPRERAPGIHWIGDWMGPRAVLDSVVKKKIPSPGWESNCRLVSVSTELSQLLYDHWAILKIDDTEFVGSWSKAQASKSNLFSLFIQNLWLEYVVTLSTVWYFDTGWL